MSLSGTKMGVTGLSVTATKISEVQVYSAVYCALNGAIKWC